MDTESTKTSDVAESIPHPFKKHEAALKCLLGLLGNQNPFPSKDAEDAAIRMLYDAAILLASGFCRHLGFQPVLERGTEAVHEWFCQLRPHAARLHNPNRPLFPWAYAALWYVTLGMAKREKRRACGSLEIDPPGKLNDPSHFAMASEIDVAVHQLPGTLLDAIQLRFYQGLTSKETALRLGITPGAVDLRVHRGMAMLRYKWRDDSQASR